MPSKPGRGTPAGQPGCGFHVAENAAGAPQVRVRREQYLPVGLGQGHRQGIVGDVEQVDQLFAAEMHQNGALRPVQVADRCDDGETVAGQGQGRPVGRDDRFPGRRVPVRSAGGTVGGDDAPLVVEQRNLRIRRSGKTYGFEERFQEGIAVLDVDQAVDHQVVGGQGLGFGLQGGDGVKDQIEGMVAFQGQQFADVPVFGPLDGGIGEIADGDQHRGGHRNDPQQHEPEQGLVSGRPRHQRGSGMIRPPRPKRAIRKSAAVRASWRSAVIAFSLERPQAVRSSSRPGWR